MKDLDLPMSIKMNYKCFPGIKDLDARKRIDESEIIAILEYIDMRYDCADFRMIPILRTLYAYSELLSKDLLERIEKTVLSFKYWMDEPGEDSMCYWSENHQLIFAAIEYLAGQYYPDKIFTNNNLSGKERKERAKLRLLDWFKYRYQYGFIEWHSNTYYEEDVAPLSLLIDFSEDEEIVKKATILLDLVLFDMAVNNYRGYFVATSGRCYEEQKKDPKRQDVLDIMKKAFGIGPVTEYDYTRLSADFVLNKKYQVPEVIKDIAISKDKFILKETLGLDLPEVREKIDPENKIETVGLYYWAMEAFTNPESVALSIEMFRKWGLKSNIFLKDLQVLDNVFLRKLKILPSLVRLLNPATQGIAIQKANTYTLRHPDYFLSTAQLYHPREFADQQHINQATLGEDITVFTTHPAKAFFSDNARNFSPSYWVGNGINPYAVQFENTALLYYDLSPRKGFLEGKRLLYTHLYFPEAKFEKVYRGENYLLGIAGKSMIGIKGLGKIKQISENEWIQEGKKTAWALTVASSDEVAFSDFSKAIINSEIVLNKKSVSYSLAHRLEIFLKKTPVFLVDGKTEKTKYRRYELPFIESDATIKDYMIKYHGHYLLLNLERAERKYE
ncbi:MAG TPA: hypothetical protein VIK96_03050 [Bacilli bacterium]